VWLGRHGYEGADIEVVWAAKQDEDIDAGWFGQPSTDILCIAQGSCGSSSLTTGWTTC